MFEKIYAAAQNAEMGNQLGEAARLIDEALALRENFDVLITAARIAKKCGDVKKAAIRLTSALALNPSSQLRIQLIDTLAQANDLTQATRVAQEGLAKKPKDFGLLNAYGVILKMQKRYQEAIEALTRATKIDPSNVVPWINSGNIYIDINQPRKALDCYQKATRLNPRDGECYRLLAGAYARIKDFDKAHQLLRQSANLAPNNAQTKLDIARLDMEAKDYQAAFEKIMQIRAQFPHFVEALHDLGFVLRLTGQIQQAHAAYEEVLRLNPHHIKTLLALGNLYYSQIGDYEIANKYYEQAYRLAPTNQEVVSWYANCLLNSRYGNEYEHIERAYEIICNILDSAEIFHEVSSTAQAVLLRNANYARLSKLGDRRELIKFWVSRMMITALHNQLGRVETMDDRMELVAAHCQWGQHVEAAAKMHPISQPAARPRSSRIRLGLMSSDLRNHAVASFVSPVIEHYDRSRFEVFCYSFSTYEPDSVQQWLASLADHFVNLPHMPERDIAQTIANDGLDILFELGGMTHMNKAQLLAWKPAPVQVSWLGYPHSCGLETIDYILVDPFIMPEQSGLLIEKPFCMPKTWVSLGTTFGFPDVPILPDLPEERHSALIFGTMNNPMKYTPHVFATWARIMKEIAASQFHFVRPEGNVRYFRENILAQFAAHGIAAERIRFTPIRGDHLPFYNEIDIALDPFPHTGGTTTCEALWMGVPTITLVGPAFFERLSYSNLSNAGLPELCAFDIDSYVNKTLALVEDRKKRKDIRQGIRHQIRKNPLGQSEIFVRDFENQIEKTLSNRGVS